MRTRHFLLAGCMALAMNRALAQAWDEGGNTIFNPLKYVGCDVNSTVPLKVMHNANQRIDWYTNAIQRLTLLPNAAYTINGFTGQVKDGSLLLSGQPDAFTNGASRAPFSRLHLIDPIGNVAPLHYAQEIGYRPWMNNGMTMTGNADQCYVGQKYNENDKTDMVLQWSDNTGEEGHYAPDRLRFLFTTTYGAALSGAKSREGLEFMRMFPKRDEDPHIGIGDFYAARICRKCSRPRQDSTLRRDHL